MSRSTVITPSQWRTQPWKNGRGTTAEVIRIPDRDDYDVRLSVADVTESGPFSTFPGYRRYTLLLEGGPVTLGSVTLVPGLLLALAGEDELAARVAAPARLLNVLARSHVQVGLGAASEADLAFALDDTPALSRWHTRVGHAPVDDGGVLWVSLRASSSIDSEPGTT